MAKTCWKCGRKGGYFGVSLDQDDMCFECASKEFEDNPPFIPEKQVFLNYTTTYRDADRYVAELRANDTLKQFAIRSCKLDGKDGLFKYYTCDYKKLISVDFDINEVTVSTVSSNAGKVLAGGLLAGGLGAMMGAAGGRNVVSNNYVSSMAIKIFLNDFDKPSIVVPLWKGANLDRKSKYFKNRINDAEPFYDLLMYIVRKNQVDAQEEASQAKNTVNPYDEIKQLKELLDMGAITQEDYDTKKKQLLGI